jgi:hypothetical protein
MMTENFQRSAARDAVLDLLAKAPADGTPIFVIMQIPNVGGRDAVDHLLGRMVTAHEIERCGRGRYVLPGRVQRASTPPQQPSASSTISRNAGAESAVTRPGDPFRRRSIETLEVGAA